MEARPRHPQGSINRRERPTSGSADRGTDKLRKAPQGHWRKVGRLLLIAAALLIGMLPGVSARAQESDDPYDAYDAPVAMADDPEGTIDPPGRVGWLSHFEGRVEIGNDDLDHALRPAELNWPVSGGDRLRSDAQGRYEVRVGGITLRADDDTEVAIIALDDEDLVVEQLSGSLAIAFQTREQAETTEVRTPYGRVDFGRAGDYRIDLRHRPQQLVVTTRAGVAFVHAENLSIAVPEGRRGEIYAGSEDYLLGPERPDDFDGWVQAREERDDRGRQQARRYVSPEMTGAESLSAYGTWSTVSDYGTIWTPHVQPVGWAPYRNGRWAWVHPWGWTWIDEAPWGFAPFHYGRWALVGSRWAWIPGHHAQQPVFAPALVVWVGGGNWSFSFSSGPAVGWFPLAPHEVFIPPRRFSRHYVNRVNRPHVAQRVIDTTVHHIHPGGRSFAPHMREFRHRHDPRAVTIVRESALRQGHAVRREVVPLREARQWRGAPVVFAPPVAPDRDARPRRGAREGPDGRDGRGGRGDRQARDWRDRRDDHRGHSDRSGPSGRQMPDVPMPGNSPVAPPVAAPPIAAPPVAAPTTTPPAAIPPRVVIVPPRHQPAIRLPQGRAPERWQERRHDRRIDRQGNRQENRQADRPRHETPMRGPAPTALQPPPSRPMAPPTTVSAPVPRPATPVPPVRQVARPFTILAPATNAAPPTALPPAIQDARERLQRERERSASEERRHGRDGREGRGDHGRNRSGPTAAQAAGGDQSGPPWMRRRLDQRRPEERP